MADEYVSEFVAEPPQWHFLQSKAKVRAYGGAMSGGKTRTICEAALDAALEFPGIQILLVRKRHTTIIETTRKTMTRFVLQGMPDGFYRQKQSQGEDWIELFNGSRMNFIGLDDPVKWYSSEIGRLIVDEAHEVSEADVVQLMSRLRQPCQECADKPVFKDGEIVPCTHFPHDTLLAFNPASPNHWLNRWFVKGAAKTKFGYVKEELWVRDAVKPRTDGCEFVFANAYANPYVPKAYIEQNLESLPELQRRRLLLGEWVLTSGSGFFDSQALDDYAKVLTPARWQGEPVGDLTGQDKKQPVKVRVSKTGPLAVWKPPVRGDEPHRYIVAVDPSSGGAADFTGIQVLDFNTFEQVAEMQVKCDPDIVADHAFRLAVIYNGALIGVETTGGWGFTVTQRIDRELLPYYKGPRQSKPQLYTRRVLDRLAKQWTDKLGWDTNTATRAPMLDSLERAVRERTIMIHGERTLHELESFVRDDKDRPGAESGEHDDLVIPLAMAVYIREQVPRKLHSRTYRQPEHKPVVGVTGY